MRIIEPARRRPQKPKHHVWRRFTAATLLVVLLGACVNYLRPLPIPTVAITVTPPPTSTITIDWPNVQQSAIAAPDYGLLGTDGDTSKPLATASIAKVIVSLCVLEKQPLKLGESGPTYTIAAKDVDGYMDNVEQGGSLLPVSVGGKLTEYQAIEALMIPSANNIADSLVRWVFGSQEAYAAYATDYLHSRGMTSITIGKDASGYDAGTAGTATDLTKLGVLALQNPVLMEIAGKKTAVLPVAGRVSNYNTVLGVNGITGLKTGNNDANPGAFLMTANVTIGDKTIPVTGAVLGADDLFTALKVSADLAASIQQGFEQVIVVSKGQQVGVMRTAWGASAPIAATKTLQLVRWKATPVSAVQRLNPDWQAQTVGTLRVSTAKVSAESPLQLTHQIAGPSFWWRLTRH